VDIYRYVDHIVIMNAKELQRFLARNGCTLKLIAAAVAT
jgi:hypothetical protein